MGSLAMDCSEAFGTQDLSGEFAWMQQLSTPPPPPPIDDLPTSTSPTSPPSVSPTHQCSPSHCRTLAGSPSQLHYDQDGFSISHYVMQNHFPHPQVPMNASPCAEQPPACTSLFPRPSNDQSHPRRRFHAYTRVQHSPTPRRSPNTPTVVPDAQSTPLTASSSRATPSFPSTYHHSPPHLQDPSANDKPRSAMHPTNLFTNQLFSGPVVHPLTPSEPFEVPAPPPQGLYPYTLPPGGLPTQSLYYQPGFLAPPYPVENNIPHPEPPVNTQPSGHVSLSQSFNDQHHFLGQRAHPHSTFFSQRSLLPHHLPKILSVGSGAKYPSHVARSGPDTGSSSSSALQPPSQHLHQRLQHPHQGERFFNGAHDFIIKKAILSDNINSDDFMSKLFKETIPGAAFDDSDRDPPPRCHPGTRVAVVNRTQDFIANCDGKKMLWIFGPAGVGKSAIMQTTAETPSATKKVVLGASIFFSIKGRADGSKAITTLAYQLAVNYTAYRQFVQGEIRNNPSLLQKAMTVQFEKFIVEPFVERFSNPHHPRFFILIDGLDECDKHHDQSELLRLISNFCITHPTSPLIWIIASRPEPQITSFFSRAEVMPAYEKEEIRVDSKQAGKDVERFLRSKLKEIQMNSPALHGLHQWPTERDFLKLAYASKGLFAYASTVVRFIDDPAYGNPVLQLEQVLDVIDTNPKWLVEGKSHPMALLDALYDRILSRVPADVMADTRKLLLLMIDGSWSPWIKGMSGVCNWLGMTRNTAYGATHHLRSVLDVPTVDEAHTRNLECFHKSFTDYLANHERSRFSSDINSVTQELDSLCAHRILEETLNGTLNNGTGITDDISLSWPCQPLNDNKTMKLLICRYAIKRAVIGLTKKIPVFQDIFFIHALSAFDGSPLMSVPNFREVLFDKSQRSDFMEHDVLEEMPIGKPHIPNIPRKSLVEYRFNCPTATIAIIPDPWDPLCEHGRFGAYREDQDHDWSSYFYQDDRCNCSKRFFHHLESAKTESSDDLVTVFVPLDLGKQGYVQYHFVDPENGVAEWTYVFSYCFPLCMGR